MNNLHSHPINPKDVELYDGLKQFVVQLARNAQDNWDLYHLGLVHGICTVVNNDGKTSTIEDSLVRTIMRVLECPFPLEKEISLHNYPKNLIWQSL